MRLAIGLTESRLLSCVKPLGSPRAGFVVILKRKYLLSGFI